jgi:hypothetical protein
LPWHRRRWMNCCTSTTRPSLTHKTSDLSVAVLCFCRSRSNTLQSSGIRRIFYFR